MTKRKKRGAIVALLILLGLAVMVMAALDTRLTVRAYTLASEKVTAPVRLVLLTDLHCCDYGEGSRELLETVAAQKPDLVLLGGDIIDDDKSLPWERGYALAEALAKSWPTYYVTGNHEFWSGEADAIRAEMERRGVTVLEGEGAELAGISLWGVDDPDVGEGEWRRQLSAAVEGRDKDKFSILLTHRPERAEDYRGLGFDLVLAGHAHGGQWRLPGLINGLIAPNQGLFPKYAGGRYELDGTTMIVSRGLARESTRVPRVFNPTEVVVIDVVGEGGVRFK